MTPFETAKFEKLNKEMEELRKKQNIMGVNVNIQEAIRDGFWMGYLEGATWTRQYTKEEFFTKYFNGLMPAVEEFT